MTRYLLDTNIISNATKPLPSQSLIEWMTAQIDDSLFISSFSLAEIWRGIREKSAGKKRRELEQWFSGPQGPQAIFRGRVLPFDENAALIWGDLMAAGSSAGRPRSAFDMVVAAIARSNNCVLVTDNERHFAGIDLFNPLRGKQNR
ncbi:MAG TPA: PIN domain-containing protein [Candidatus Angelobacter sp.]|nr:PIN domain-containing protein [Candidatus Angelobacter sp.]